MANITPARLAGTYCWQTDCSRKAAALQKSPRNTIVPRWSGVICISLNDPVNRAAADVHNATNAMSSVVNSIGSKSFSAGA